MNCSVISNLYLESYEYDQLSWLCHLEKALVVLGISGKRFASFIIFLQTNESKLAGK